MIIKSKFKFRNSEFCEYELYLPCRIEMSIAFAQLIYKGTEPPSDDLVGYTIDMTELLCGVRSYWNFSSCG